MSTNEASPRASSNLRSDSRTRTSEDPARKNEYIPAVVSCQFEMIFPGAILEPRFPHLALAFRGSEVLPKVGREKMNQSASSGSSGAISRDPPSETSKRRNFARSSSAIATISNPA